jgi:NitT/TauT family transport system substrate-binding protein
VAKKEKNIKTLLDFNGKKIGIWKSGFDEIPKSLVQKNNLKVTWVPLLSSVNMFMMDGIDVMTVMWYNEYDQIINSGYNPEELTTFFFSDLGFNVPEDGLYCLDSTYHRKKDELQKFVRATLKGWEYARFNQEETIQVVLKYMKKEHVPTNYAHQKWMLEKVLQLMQPTTSHVKNGVLQPEHFNKAQELLLNGKFISKKIPYLDFYKPVL